jgi:hypothetical protein
MSLLGRRIFVLARIRPAPTGGVQPDLPDDVGYEEIAAAHPKARFRLYACFPAEKLEGRTWPGVKFVEDVLQDLLMRADKHPRALSLLRQEILKYYRHIPHTAVTPEDFQRIIQVLCGEALEAPEVDIHFEISPYGPDDVW